MIFPLQTTVAFQAFLGPSRSTASQRQSPFIRSSRLFASSLTPRRGLGPRIALLLFVSHFWPDLQRSRLSRWTTTQRLVQYLLFVCRLPPLFRLASFSNQTPCLPPSLFLRCIKRIHVSTIPITNHIHIQLQLASTNSTCYVRL